MSDDRRAGDAELHLLEQGLTFYGTITASVSHELNNVVSIIDQTTGLLEDMIAAVERGKPISADRLEHIAGSLRKQTVRGLNIIKHLNEFAHSSDVPRRRYDVVESVVNVVELSRRLADMKRVEIYVRSGSDIPECSGNPFFARRVLFEPVRLALLNARAGDRIDVCVEGSGANAEVSIEVPSRALKPEQLATPSFQGLLSQACATISVEEKEDRITCRLVFASGE